MAKEFTYDELEKRMRKVEQESADYKQSSKQITAAHERLQYLLSSTSAVIYTAKTSDDYRATFISDNIALMVGYEPNEFLKDSSFWIDRVHPEDVSRISEEVPKIFEKGLHIFEYRFKHKNGKYIWIRDEMKLVRDNNGEPLEIIGYWVDVTKRKMAEENLQKSEKRFREFLDNLGDVAYEADSLGHVTYANKMSEVITGLSLENIIGKQFLPLFTEETKEIAQEVYQRTLNGERPEYELTFTNGKICHFKNEPLRDGNGKIIGVFGIAREITERKKMEKALRESNDKYRSLIESSIDGIAIVQGLEIKFVNSSLIKMYGFQNEEEMVGHTFTEFVSPAYRNLMTQMGLDRERGAEIPGRYEFKALRKDGMEFDVEIFVSAISYGEGLARQGILRDITVQKQAEETLKNSYDDLERRVKERTSELEIANEKLRQEIERNKKTEEELRKREKELENKTVNLEEMNTALKVLLKKREEDRIEIEEKILLNVKELVEPYLEKLKNSGLNGTQKIYTDILESNVKDIISPFIGRLSTKYLKLTPSEIQIANLIRQGRRTKEIVELFHLSPRTIKFHRESIRKKLDITNTKSNLRSRLMSLQ